MDKQTKTRMERALGLLSADDYSMGDGWRTLHDIVGPLEGDPIADRIHALLHRIEGDDFNAHYWYRKAGIEVFDSSFELEASAISAALDSVEERSLSKRRS